jgi:cobyrinic acid a,c-diamide synthase
MSHQAVATPSLKCHKVVTRSVGKTTVTTTTRSWGPAGLVARGHEFHFSTSDPVPGSVERAWRLERSSGGRDEGYVVGRLLATYAHLHFGSNPGLAAGFVEACRRARA